MLPMAAAIVCVRDGLFDHSVMTFWRDEAEALAALHELCTPVCGRGCRSTHVLVYGRDGRAHVVADDAPAPCLADELRELYPRRPSTPELWDTPEDLNQPLERSALPASDLRTRITRGEALALLRQLAENRPGSAVGATNGLQPCNYPKPNRRSRQKANQP